MNLMYNARNETLLARSKIILARIVSLTSIANEGNHLTALGIDLLGRVLAVRAGYFLFMGTLLPTSGLVLLRRLLLVSSALHDGDAAIGMLVAKTHSRINPLRAYRESLLVSGNPLFWSSARRSLQSRVPWPRPFPLKPPRPRRFGWTRPASISLILSSQ